MDDLAIISLVLLHIAVELNVDCDFVSWELPGVVIKPVVWNFDLVSIDDLLLEDTIAVPQTISPGRIIQRRHAVQETGCETSQASVTQSRIVFLADNVFDLEAEIIQPLWYVSVLSHHDGKTLTSSGLFQPNVQHSIVQRTTHEEFERKI